MLHPARLQVKTGKQLFALKWHLCNRGSGPCHYLCSPPCCTLAWPGPFLWLQVNTGKQLFALKRYLCDMQHSRPITANVKLSLVVSSGIDS